MMLHQPHLSVLLRGIEPEMKEYDDQELLSDFSQAGFRFLMPYLEKGFDEDGNKITKENLKAQYIPNMAVKKKTMALDALQRGLTLDGKSNEMRVSLIPLPAMTSHTYLLQV